MANLGSDERIRLLKTGFVVYYHADFEEAKSFFLDFGLQVTRESQDEIFFHGYGVEPFCYVLRASKDESNYFGGAAYVVESRHELEKATKIVGASQITKLDAPGGGEIVTLTDPVGHLVHLIHGQEEKLKQDFSLEKLTVNYEDEKPRRGKFQRFKPGPAPIHRWGHYGVTYPDGQYQAMFDWYTKHLALGVSDIVSVKDKPVTAFFHIDRDKEFTDHHCFFFKKAKPGHEPSVAHSAFEVHDFDIQQLGHDFLDSKGHQLCWGVGRHVLGSQIFDYWFDPGMFIVEHYADGDLVNSETPVAHVQAGPDALSVWGPSVPEVF
jgi:hypothetical protein